MNLNEPTFDVMFLESYGFDVVQLIEPYFGVALDY